MYSEYPDNFFHATVLIQKLGWHYAPSKDEPLWSRLFWPTYNAFWITFCFLVYFPLELLKLRDTKNVTADLIEHSGIIFIHWLGVFRLINLFAERRTVERLKSTLNDVRFRYDDCGEFRPASVVRENLAILYRYGGSFFVIGMMVPISKVMEAGYDFYNHVHLLSSGNTTCQTLLPYYAQFPFETETPRGCIKAYLIQMWPLITWALPIICYDITFLSLCLFVRAHLQNLQGAFKNIRSRCMQELRLTDSLSSEEELRLDYEILCETKRLTSNFQVLIQVRDAMEGVFSFTLVIQVLIQIFVMVSCLFLISNEPLFSPTFTAEMDYFIGAVIQSGFYCILGNEISFQSEKIATSIYESDWYAMSPQIKSMMLINMMRVQKPMVLTVGKFADLSLSVWVTMIRGSYSYFAVLKQTS